MTGYSAVLCVKQHLHTYPMLCVKQGLQVFHYVLFEISGFFFLPQKNNSILILYFVM